MNDQPYKTSPKDIFLHIMSIAALYAATVAFLTLLFQYINILLPDPLESRYVLTGAHGAIRFAVATLIIVFPVYVFLLRLLKREYINNTMLKEARIRKWLVYFTLFAAGVIVMGDLVAIVYSFLGGEITLRFVLKILSVLLVVGSVFLYYFWDIKNIRPAGMNIFQYAVVGSISISIVAAFFIVGSPQSERLRRFDEQRIGDLSQIQWQILTYWQSKGMLPEDISHLEDDIGGFYVPLDPQTNEAYGYRVQGDLMFSLCANFALPNRNPGSLYAFPSLGVSESWEHGEGRVCFERTIDPDIHGLKQIAPVR